MATNFPLDEQLGHVRITNPSNAIPEASTGRSSLHKLKRKLIRASQSDGLSALEELTALLHEVQQGLQVSHVSLMVYSCTLGLQTVMASSGKTTPFTPSPATAVPSYASVHHLTEILEDDPDAKNAHFSVAQGLPDDLKAVATAEGLSEFRLQALCNNQAEVKGVLVLAHSDLAPFKDANEAKKDQQPTPWDELTDMIDVLFSEALRRTRLSQYIMFAEMLQVVTTQADIVNFVSQWMPLIVFGPWANMVECALGVLSSRSDKFTLYKAVERSAESGSKETMKETVARSRSATVQRIASVSKRLAVSSASLQVVSETLILPRLEPGSLSASMEQLLLPRSVLSSILHTQQPRERTCFFKHMELKASLLESVLSNEALVSIADVRQHISESSVGLMEILFNVNVGAPKSLLVLPLFTREARIYGCLYFMSYCSHNLIGSQEQIELLLAVAAPVLAEVMSRRKSGRKEPKQLQAYQRAIRQLVTTRNGENKALEPFREVHNMTVLQQMFTGIISDSKHWNSTPPQVCSPESIKIESVAGHGAFAVVYRGRLDLSDTLVAVKVMPIDPSMDAMTLVRNATEIAALSKIRHHNIVQIVAQFPECVLVQDMAGSTSGSAGISIRQATTADRADSNSPRLCCVLVMEFCTYGTLLNALQMDVFKHPNGKPNMSSICSVLLEIASALAHIHNHGIIHCDLKPQNVLLKADECSPRGFVSKLTDFGLARVVTRERPLLCGDSAGTPSHLAPEIVKIGEQESVKTAKSDIYAFGILMWEMFTAQQAFWMVDKHAVLTHVVLERKRLPFPNFADPKYVDLCKRCWDADMDARPTLEVVQADLKAIMNMRSSSGTPPSRSASRGPAASGSPSPTSMPLAEDSTALHPSSSRPASTQYVEPDPVVVQHPEQRHMRRPWVSDGAFIS